MNLTHGNATLRKDLMDDKGNVIRKKGETGEITTFLINDDKFSVMFDGCIGMNNWFTFDRVSFEMFFDYKLTP